MSTQGTVTPADGDGRTMEVKNPATGARIAEVPALDRATTVE